MTPAGSRWSGSFCVCLESSGKGRAGRRGKGDYRGIGEVGQRGEGVSESECRWIPPVIRMAPRDSPDSYMMTSRDDSPRRCERPPDEQPSGVTQAVVRIRAIMSTCWIMAKCCSVRGCGIVERSWIARQHRIGASRGSRGGKLEPERPEGGGPSPIRSPVRPKSSMLRVSRAGAHGPVLRVAVVVLLLSATLAGDLEAPILPVPGPMAVQEPVVNGGEVAAFALESGVGVHLHPLFMGGGSIGGGF
jgi:hypothetical protein